MDVFLHEEAVYGISVDPINDNVFASACDDGRVVLYDVRAPASEGTNNPRGKQQSNWSQAWRENQQRDVLVNFRSILCRKMPQPDAFSDVQSCGTKTAGDGKLQGRIRTVGCPNPEEVFQLLKFQPTLGILLSSGDGGGLVSLGILF